MEKQPTGADQRQQDQQQVQSPGNEDAPGQKQRDQKQFPGKEDENHGQPGADKEEQPDKQ